MEAGFPSFSTTMDNQNTTRKEERLLSHPIEKTPKPHCSFNETPNDASMKSNDQKTS